MTAAKTSRHSGDKLAAIRSFHAFCGGAIPAPAWPLELFLEASNVCDLKCAMCREFSAYHLHRPAGLRATPRGFLDLEMIGRLDPLLRRALLVHCFGYGEATLHPQFRAMIEQVSRYEPLIDFFTHGMHLDEEVCRFLVDHNVYKVTISLSGLNRAVYDAFYIGGDYDRVLAGIRRLAAAKAGRRYPLIEINSLSFREHVETFDAFVELMAAQGADIVHLKQLQHFEVAPQVQPHISVMRPWVEGEIVRRAVAAGTRLGIQVNADQYLALGVADEAAYHQRLREISTEVSLPVSEPAAGTPRALALSEDKETVSGLLAPRDAGTSGFACMEPFKTLYLTRNGAVKPCCFANSNAWHLGDVGGSGAEDIWNGIGFEVVREAIMDGRYSQDICGRCLSRQLGPKSHFAHDLIGTYLDWHGSHFGHGLHQVLADADPQALLEISRSPGHVIAARHRTSPPAALDGTVAALPDDAVQGYVEQVGDLVVGWAWSPNLPDARLPVSVWGDDCSLLAQGNANIMRGDLAEAGKGDGGHGFRIPLPAGHGGLRDALSVSVGNDRTRRRLPHLEARSSQGNEI